MGKNIVVGLMGIAIVALAVVGINSRRELAEARSALEQLEAECAKNEELLLKPCGVEDGSAETVASVVSVPAEEQPAVETEEPEASGRRMMRSMSKMLDNPTMNKVMEASQRGAVGALYSDLIEYLDLDAEEAKYFMDLLMYRQMKQMDLGMKMMSGELGEKEKKALGEELKQAGDTLKEEMEKFLNDPDDVAEWEFYEKTMGERMMLSQMDQTLGAEAALSDESYRELLGMMHEERTGYDFSSDLNDEKNMDMSAERFSKENIDAHASDIRKLNEQMIARAEGLLTPEQSAAFAESLKTMTEMQVSQLEMAAQMFGGK